MSAGLPRMALLPAFASLLAVVASAQTERPPGDAGESDSDPALQHSTLDDPWSGLEPDFSNPENRTLQRRSTENASPVLAGKGKGTQRHWARTLGALAGVVGLIVFLAWGYRAMTGGHVSLLGKVKRPGLIEVISKTSLSARQTLCLVRIGPRLVLIGQTHDSLRALDVIDDPDLVAQLAGEAARKRPDSSQKEFQACLERQARGYQDPAEHLDEDIMPDGRRIAGVQQRVTETIQRVRRAVARV